MFLIQTSMKQNIKTLVIETFRNMVCVLTGISIVALSVYAMFVVPEAETFLTFLSMTTAGVCMFVLTLDTTKAALSRTGKEIGGSKTPVPFKLNKTTYDLAPKA